MAPASPQAQQAPASKKKAFMAYRSHIGGLDGFLGISNFWSEKFFVVMMYLQRLALLMLWPGLNWPVSFSVNIRYIYAALLDFTAHQPYANAIGHGTIFEGCDYICKVAWPMLCLPVLALWIGLAMHKTLPLYYARNFERILWGLVRVGLLPFCNTLLRYFILNEDGKIESVYDTGIQWNTPISEIGVVLFLATIFLFWVVAWKRSTGNVLFGSALRHEAWIRARELEYKLRFSTVYRNERVWMVSSYTRWTWWWSFVRGGLDVFMLVLMSATPPKYGIIVACVFLGLNFIFGFVFVDIHRCWSSNVMEHLLNFTIFIFAIAGALRAWGTRNPLLVDRDLDYFLYGINGGSLALVLLLAVYFFWDGHKFGSGSIADQRARKKWQLTYGATGDKANKLMRSGTWVSMPLAQSKSEKLEAEAEAQQAAAAATGDTRFAEIEAQASGGTEEDLAGGFYLPKEATFFSLNCASPHVWPVNGVVINELLRRNQQDHLIDVLRAARKMLDRISALHNTAMLIPTDEMKQHISRLKECLVQCQKARVTHHVNAIHPLQGTFEDLIEQFSFELRVFAGRSITVGHNARKMITVSRYLRKRMLVRDNALALVSPLMRRVLIKLLALRMWIQLLEDRHSLLPRRDNAEFEKFAADIGGDSDSDDGFGRKLSFAQEDVFGNPGDLAVNVPLLDDEEFDFATSGKESSNRSGDPKPGSDEIGSPASGGNRQSFSFGRSNSLSQSNDGGGRRQRVVGFFDEAPEEVGDKKND